MNINPICGKKKLFKKSPPRRPSRAYVREIEVAAVTEDSDQTRI